MPGDDDGELAAGDVAAGGLDARDDAVRGGDALHLALLDDVHAHVGAGAGVAPGHGVVARGAAAGLPEGAQDRVARPLDVDDGAELLDRGGEMNSVSTPWSALASAVRL
jgi:hypothetical protein